MKKSDLPNILEYMDYRVFMRDFFETRRQSSAILSYRYLGQKLDIDPSQLLKIVQGQLHLAERKIVDVVKFCRLKGFEVEYFKLLVGYNKAKRPEQARLYFEKLAMLSGVPKLELASEQYAFFLQWHYFGIWCALNVFDCNDKNFAELGQFMAPQVDRDEVKRSIEMLLRMNLIAKNESGFYKSTNQNLSTGSDWRNMAVRQFQKQMIQLGQESLDRFSKTDRDVSSLTLNVSEDTLEEMRVVTEEYRRTLVKLSNQCEETDRVLQVNVQLFPITHKIPKAVNAGGQSVEE